MNRNRQSFFEVSDYIDGGTQEILSPLRSPEDTSLPRLHMPALSSSPQSRGPAYELSMFKREQAAGFRK